MDIPQEISEKIASYIRRPNKDEDIIVEVFGRTRPGLEFSLPLDDLLVRLRDNAKTKESVIKRHATYFRKKWAKGERNLRLY